MDDKGEQIPNFPEIPRRVRVYRFQRIGIPILFLLPFLALVGILDQGRGQITGRSEYLEMHIEYPLRTFYAQPTEITLGVENVSARALSAVVVRLDSSFLAAFSVHTVVPSSQIAAHEISLGELKAGEARRLIIEVEAQRYGRFDGIISVASASADSVHVSIRTFILP